MNEDFNLADRILCGDDACIGLVGADGKCKVCGLEYQGPESLPVTGEEPVAVDDTGDDMTDEVGGAVFPDGPQSGTHDLDIDDRVLCPDDTCIGVIGSSGTCGTCGKSG